MLGALMLAEKKESESRGHRCQFPYKNDIIEERKGDHGGKQDYLLLRHGNHV